jgi:hypothetical protein
MQCHKNEKQIMNNITNSDLAGRNQFSGVLSIGILSYNTSGKLRKCLNSIREHLRDIPVAVLDNASTDDSVEMVKREFPDIRLYQSKENLFFAWGCNQLAEFCTTRYVLLMNADVFFGDSSVTEIVKYMDENPQIIATSPLIQDGSILWHRASGIITPWRCIARDSIAQRFLKKTRWFRRVMFEDVPLNNPFIVPKITNGSCVVRRKEFLEAGGFSYEQILYWTEEEFALRVKRLGYLQAVYGKAVVYHEHGSSTKTLPKSLIRAIHVRDRIHYMRREYGLSAVIIVEFMLMLRLQIWKSFADYLHFIHHHRTIRLIVKRICKNKNNL